MRTVPWATLHPVTRRLIETRTLRSVAQGALTVDFVLYLDALHWSAAAIGLLLAATSLLNALLSLGGGVLSDRHGRRRFLLVYQAATVVLTAAMLLDASHIMLIVVSVLLGFGRVANGGAGIFAPVEQAWLAQNMAQRERGQIFSFMNSLSFIGMGVGALLGAGVPLLGRVLPGATAYLPLFWLNIAIGGANYVQVAGLREQPPERMPPAKAGGAPEMALRRQENRYMALLAGVNAVGALGMGLFAPILPYWFAVRYGVGPDAIGPIYALGYFLAAVSSVAAGELTVRFGLVRAVVWIRLAGVVLLIALPLMPTFVLAAAAYTLRTVLNRGSMGARQAFTVNIVRDSRRGLATSLNNLSVRLPSAIGPAVAGWLIGLGQLSLPLFLAAALQFAYAVLFGSAFRNAAVDEDPVATAAVSGNNV